MRKIRQTQDRDIGDFCGGPVVKTLLSNTGDVCWIPAQGAKIPTCLIAKKPKHKMEAILNQIQ